MCGISGIIEGVEISEGSGQVERREVAINEEDLRARLVNRGPDSLKETVVEVGEGVRIRLLSSVLSLRGELVAQPLIDAKGNVFLWNGELFDGYEIGVHENDTKLVAALLSEVDSDDPREIVSKLVKIKGPFAFIYWQSKQRKMWFGRDVLGRRSILVNNSMSNTFIISSMATFPNPNAIDESNLPRWDEVNTFGLYSIDFTTDQNQKIQATINSHRWDNSDNTLLNNIGITSNYSKDENDDDDDTTTNANENSSTDQNQNSAIDQLHFYPFGKRSQFLPHGGEWKEDEFRGYIEALTKVLSKSIYTRVCNLPDESSTPPDLVKYPGRSGVEAKPLVGRLGILFSGGLDSMVVAALSHRYIPENESIHLINVSFGEDAHGSKEYDQVADRKTGISGLAELQQMAPNRKWVLIKVNVSQSEMEWAKMIVYQLMYPANTIMDMTICLALWFAARGEGIVHGDESEQRVMSTCKVLLMGSGADEQFAGYGRHRSAFARGSWEVLQAELNKDFNRIWKRNLGRDDRVISSNRREPRFPYLDENVIEFLNQVPLSYVCDLALPQGTGDKRLLRELAKTLGLTQSTQLIKRAIQFGSKSSKVLNKNVPARVTQKCGKEVFSFDKPLYDPTQDPGFELAQKMKLKQQMKVNKQFVNDNNKPNNEKAHGSKSSRSKRKENRRDQQDEPQKEDLGN